LILTTFRINVQMLSRTQNRMWLDEISIDNAAWINPETAAAKGIVDSDRIKIKSLLGEIEAVAKMTENVVPEAITMSSHGGRWEYGRYASGEKAPYGIDVDSPYEELKWWPADGGHPNRIIPNSSEPISGQQR
jgi:anaerobic selenocysteine-containing dehydrogenase